MKHQYTQVRVHRKGLPCFFLAVLTGIITMIAAMAANAAIAPTKTETGRYGYYQAPQAGETIHIDGLAEESCWEKAAWSPIDQLWLGVQPEPEDFSGRFKVLWDEDHLYILVEIIDDVLFDRYPDPLDNYYKDDCLEIFLDEDHSGGDHTHNFNAFAYHIALDYNIVDIYAKHRAAPSRFLNDHAVVKGRLGREREQHHLGSGTEGLCRHLNPAKKIPRYSFSREDWVLPWRTVTMTVAMTGELYGVGPILERIISYRRPVLATLELMP